MPDYRLCGWHVRSEILLPEAPPWDGAPPPEIVIRRAGGGDCSRAPPPERAFAPDLAAVSVPGVGHFLIRDGREVLVAPCDDAEPTSLANALCGGVLGVLCHQRGLLPLHAGAVAVARGTRAIIITGDSGAGKSSLTAVLVRQGGGLLAEDLCPLRLAPATRPAAALVLPNIPRFRLCPDVMAHLRWPSPGYIRAATASGATAKCVVRHPAADLADAAPPVAIYHIGRHILAAAPRIERIAGVAALEMLRGSVYRWDLAAAMGCAEAALRRAASLVDAVPCFRLWRTRDLAGIERTARLILRHAADPPASAKPTSGRNEVGD